MLVIADLHRIQWLAMKYVPPSVRETAFNCPHCSALANQFWYAVLANRNEDKRPTPLIYDEDKFDLGKITDAALLKTMSLWVEKMKKTRPFLEFLEDTKYSRIDIYNLFVSKCFNCDDIAIWIHERLVYPQRGEGPPPNSDMPEDIRRDYDEASAILDLSPRGAAALIRLAIQKLCKHLGQSGENINEDIKSLVAAGLDPRIQKALDVVRVIGNNAVHPGKIDIKDDRAIAENLFRLLNLIVDKMISEPKHIDEVYALLPEGARKAIEKRDGK